MFAASFSGLGFSLPFFPVWLKETGLGEAAIGIILACPMIVRMMTTTYVAGLADHHIQPARLLAILNAVVSAGYLLLWPQTGFWPILLIVMVLSVGQSGIIPVADALANAHVKKAHDAETVDYGRIRVWGSVSFLVVNLAGGYIISAAGVQIVPAVMAACAAWAVCAALLAPSLPKQGTYATHQDVLQAELDEAAPYQKNAFYCMILASALVQASHGALYAFGTLYWQAAGIDDIMIGALWAVGVAAEILLFILAGRLARPGVGGLIWIMAGGGVAAVRFAMMALVPGLIPAFFMQILHGLSFGLTHLGTIAAIGALAPAGRRGRAQGQVTALHAVVMALATVLSGLFFARVGGWTFLAMVPLALAGAFFSLLARHVAASAPKSSQRHGS